jgi:ribosomal protein S6
MNETEKEMKIYEVGFHVVPTIGEEEARTQFVQVKTMITDAGGSIISEGDLALRNLAYTLTKTTKAVKTKYNKAYFGWIKFEMSAEDIGNIKKNIEGMDSVIRHLITLTVRENTMIGKPDAVLAEEGEEVAEEAQNVETTGEEKAPETLEDLDKTIDDLVVQ